jgi:hypothetical protein
VDLAVVQVVQQVDPLLAVHTQELVVDLVVMEMA